MNKTQKAEALIRQAMTSGKDNEESARIVESVTGLGVYTEKPVPFPMGRHSDSNLFELFAKGKTGRWTRSLKRFFVIAE